MPFFGKSDSILASVGSKRDAQHKYMTKKAKRNILRQIQQKYLQEIDFSNLPKWEEAPPEMGGGHSRYWSIKWYGGRGRFNQGLAAASTVPPVVFSLPW